MAQVVCILNQAEPCLYPLQFDTLYPRGNIPLSVHLLHESHCIEHRYVPLLELVFLTCDTCSLLCIIAFVCYENKKRQARWEYYIIFGSNHVAFEQSTKFLSPFLIILGLA